MDSPYIQPAMKRVHAVQFAPRPGGQQQRQMPRFAGACQLVFTKALALQKERFERGDKTLGDTGVCKLLTECA